MMSSIYDDIGNDKMKLTQNYEHYPPYLKQSDAGAIVVISSIAAIENFFAPCAYNTMKASIINYAKHLGQQVAPEGIRVNCVSPGPICHQDGFWEIAKRDRSELYQQTLAKIPIGRMGTPEDVANSVVFLASSRSGFTTGTNLIVDGGMTQGIQY